MWGGQVVEMEDDVKSCMHISCVFGVGWTQSRHWWVRQWGSRQGSRAETSVGDGNGPSGMPRLWHHHWDWSCWMDVRCAVSPRGASSQKGTESGSCTQVCVPGRPGWVRRVGQLLQGRAGRPDAATGNHGDSGRQVWAGVGSSRCGREAAQGVSPPL